MWLNLPVVVESRGRTRYTRMTLGPKAGAVFSDTGDTWGGTATLWQRGLFLDGGWRGDNGLGVLNTNVPALMREQYRFLLPSVPFAGISTDWQQAGRSRH